MDCEFATDMQNSFEKDTKECETKASSNSRRVKRKCSFKSPVPKQLKIESENLKNDSEEKEPRISVNNTEVKANVLRRSKRNKNVYIDVPTVKNASTDINISPNDKNFKTGKVCNSKFISEKVIKNLDNIFFPDDTKDDSSSEQNNINDMTEQKQISSTQKMINEFQLPKDNVTDNTYPLSIKISYNNHTPSKESVEDQNQNLLPDISLTHKLDLCDKNKKNVENDTKEEKINSNDIDTNAETGITFGRGNTDQNEQINITRKEIHVSEEKIYGENITVFKAVNCLTPETECVDAERKNMSTLQTNDTEETDLIKAESLNKILSDVSSHQLDNVPIIDQLYTDIKKADTLINLLANANNTEENRTFNGNITYSNVSKDVALLPYENNCLEENFNKKCDKTREISENFKEKENFQSKSELSESSEAINEEYKTLCFHQQTFKSEGVNLNVNNKNTQKMNYFNSDEQDKNIMKRDTLPCNIVLHDMKLKSTYEHLNKSTGSNIDKSSAKEHEPTFSDDKKTYFTKKIKDSCTNNLHNCDTKQEVSQNFHAISDRILTTEENINNCKEESKLHTDVRDSSKENLESKPHKLSLLYMSALEYDKCQIMEVDDLKINKEIKDDSDAEVPYKSRNSEADICKQSDLEFFKQNSNDFNKSDIQIENIINTSSSNNSDRDKYQDKDPRRKNERNYLSTQQNLSDSKKSANEIEDENLNELMYDLQSSEAVYDQFQIKSGENEIEFNLTDSKKEVSQIFDIHHPQEILHDEKTISPSLSSIQESICDNKLNKKPPENNITMKNEECCENKFHEHVEMQFLVTATDCFNSEKMTEIESLSATAKCSTNMSQTDKNAANADEKCKSYFDAEDSFDMDDDFDLTASQLSMIDIDEKNHFKELGKTANSFQQTESCMNTHFSQDSITVEIIDQLCYIRESVDSIKDLLNTLLKKN